MRTLAVALLASLLTTGACANAEEGKTPRGAAESFVVTERARGLDHPWDVQSLQPGWLLVSERDQATLSVIKGKRVVKVKFPTRKIWVSGETGLMGLAVDPAYKKNRRIYTCSGWRTAGGHDIRVNVWHLNRQATKAKLVRPLLTGLPTTSGRHGGCRLLIAKDGSLYVGTGDAAVGTNPRNLNSLGGKTLRLNRTTGRPWPTNPLVNGSGPRRYIDSLGHRNIQGLAQRADGTIWSVEHGPDRDDEINLIKPGGDYGWHPVPGYNESVDMTDQDLPGDQIEAAWSSGSSTIATSGASWVKGQGWGPYAGTLAVGVLKDSEVAFFKFNADGEFTAMVTPPQLKRFGRIRSVTSLSNGKLLLTTDNGGDSDRVLQVSPR